MEITQNITEDIYYVGASDKRLGLFENLFPIPSGVSYNSYLIMDDKTCLLDTVDASVSRQFFSNIESILKGRTLDYLVVHHMEPDHAAMIEDLLLRYPNVTIVLTDKAATFLKQANPALSCITQVVKEGDTLSLGKHTLSFLMAPMVHWPEVMMSYEMKNKILFSADAFGTFGSLDGNIFASELYLDETFYSEARRYYSNIVGKYGRQVQAVLHKAAQIEIQYLCPLHGPIWNGEFQTLLEKYNLWSSYQAEVKGVLICYGSMYGNTENAALYLANELAKLKIKNIKIYDVSQTDVSYLISDTFKYTNIVLMAPNYNGGIYPKMNTYLDDMLRLSVSNRKFYIVENGTWAPVIAKKIEEYILKYPGSSLPFESIKMKSRGTEETKIQLAEMAKCIGESL